MRKFEGVARLDRRSLPWVPRAVRPGHLERACGPRERVLRNAYPVTKWPEYLDGYHTAHPGITETLLNRVRGAQSASPYAWLAAALPAAALHGVDPARGAPPARLTVLDLGCGSAPLEPLLLAHQYVGLDRSAAELKGARLRARGPLVQADALALPLRTDSVDVVLAPMSLMLVQPVDVALAELARVLHPGGMLAALLPNSHPVHAIDLLVAARMAFALRRGAAFPQRLRRRSLARLLTSAGFDVEQDRAQRFALPIASIADAELAVDGLYLPGLSTVRRAHAIEILGAHLGRVELPVPLRRVIARRTT